MPRQHPGRLSPARTLANPPVRAVTTDLDLLFGHIDCRIMKTILKYDRTDACDVTITHLTWGAPGPPRLLSQLCGAQLANSQANLLHRVLNRI